MRRPTLLLGVAVLVVAGIVTWRLWQPDPRPVPELTQAQVARLDRRLQGAVRWVGGGSREEAHRLWVRYHDQEPYEGVTPRLLGISRVHVSAAPRDAQQSGYFWLVYCDRAWEPNLGGVGGPAGWYSREVIMVRQGGGTTSGDIHLF
jgi:hypothetical protein